MFKTGDCVVYRVSKHTPHPGPRARDVRPEPEGEYYSYEVDKYWVVADVLSDGKLVLRTRQGKEHVVDPNDPKLRRANWRQRVLHRKRFPHIRKQREPASASFSGKDASS